MTRRRSRAELPAPEDGALLLGQPLAVVNKTDGDRTHVYRPLAQPGLVGSNCAVGVEELGSEQGHAKVKMMDRMELVLASGASTVAMSSM